MNHLYNLSSILLKNHLLLTVNLLRSAKWFGIKSKFSLYRFFFQISLRRNQALITSGKKKELASNLQIKLLCSCRGNCLKNYCLCIVIQEIPLPTEVPSCYRECLYQLWAVSTTLTWPNTEVGMQYYSVAEKKLKSVLTCMLQQYIRITFKRSILLYSLSTFLLNVVLQVVFKSKSGAFPLSAKKSDRNVNPSISQSMVLSY